MDFLEFINDDESMECCGVSYLRTFPFEAHWNDREDGWGDPVEPMTEARLVQDLREAKNGAREDNRALILATTVEGQSRCFPIMEAEGFQRDATARRPGEGNGIILWSHAIGGSAND